jgi:iron complex outermembrane receptor protein
VRNDKNILALAIMAACGIQVSTAVAQGTSDSARSMEELRVYGTQSGLENETGSRLGLTVLETPATVDVIDGNAIRARIDTSVLDAVTRSAGFSNEANPGNGHSSIAARGFRGQGTVTKLYDGTNYYTAAGTNTFPFDTWGIERIEVLKGPSSVLYGEGGLGGAINVIPRAPQYERAGDVRLIMGENNTAFIGLDYTDGLSDSVAYRVDVSKSESDNWVDNGASDAEMFSFALRWDVSEDLVVSARYDWGEQSPMKYFGVPVLNGAFVPEFVGLNFNVADAYVSYKDDSIRVKADLRVSDTTSLRAEIFRLSTDRYWRNTEYYSFDSGTQLVDRWDPLVIGHDMDHTGVRTNLRLAPSGGGVRASIGFEANEISYARPTNFGPANPDPIDWGNDFDTVDPNNFQPGSLLSLTDAPVLPDDMSDVGQFAVFGEAQFHLTERLALVAALRYDDFQTDYTRLGRAPIDQNADSLTGRLGAVFDLSDNTALYGQYGTGATHPSNSVVTASAANRESELIESEQIEFGIKHQVAGTGLQWNLALFDIVKNNLIEDDPDSGDPADLIVIPEQTSLGFEIGFSYAASERLQFHGNLSKLNAETDTGETPTYVPEETWNLGFAWSAGERLRLIADARYVGERFHGTVPIPAYTVVDASARWALSSDLALTLKADNLFDELYASSSYYSDTWLVGKLRTWSVAVDYSF